jgi:hypothetical protein
MASHLPSSRAFVTQLLNSLPVHTVTHLDGSVDATHRVPVAPDNPLNSASEPVKKQLLTLHVLFPNEFLPALDLLDRRLVTRFRIRRNSAIDEHAAPLITTTGDSRERERNTAETQLDAHRQGNISEKAVEQTDPSNTEAMDVDTTTTTSTTQPPDTLRTGTAENLPPKISQTSIKKPEPAIAQPHNPDTLYYVRSAQQRTSRFSITYDTTTSYEVRLRAWNCSCPAFAFAAFPSLHPEPSVSRYNEAEGVIEGVLDSKNLEWVFGGVSLGEGMPPVCKHLLACVLVERCGMFGGFVEERDVSVEEAAGWAAGWGD